MVATVWEAGRGMHWTAKSWAKRSVKSRKIRGIKIAPTATCVKGNCKGCHSCCMEIILIYYLVKMLTGSQYFEIFKQHILQQSKSISSHWKSPFISSSRKWIRATFEFFPVHLLLQVWYRTERNTWKDGSGINMKCLILQKKDRETDSENY